MIDPLTIDLNKIVLMWELEDALALVRDLEKETAKIPSGGWHIALTGGVLYSGCSDKDLDIVCYPHCTDSANRTDCCAALAKFGIEFVCEADHHEYGDDKIIHQTVYKGKRIDVFFMR